MHWTTYLWMALGGGLGTLLRGVTNKWLPFETSSFAWGTFSVNMIGCFLIGFLWGKIESVTLKYFLVTGVLGGLTTFSGMGLELFRYFNDKAFGLMAIYGFLSLAIGIFMVWLGQKLF